MHITQNYDYLHLKQFMGRLSIESGMLLTIWLIQLVN